ncbi:MAG: sulfotransferase [Arenimonas sp.]|jgi:tetratricopeptide (TPR) repeat protein
MSGSTEVLLRQAETLHRQGRRLEAIEVFRQVLATRPDSTEGWYELGYLLKAEGKYEDALEAYGQALARGVKRPEEVHLNRAVIYSDHLRRDELAEHELKAALTLAPDYVPARLNLGNLHEERGERAEALACYAQIMPESGGSADAYRDLRCEALARTSILQPPGSVDDPLFQHLHDAATTLAQTPIVRANVLFALGRAYDRLDEFDKAFDAYARANRCLLRESGKTYDRAHSTRLIDAMIAAFPTAAQGGIGAATGAAPLFICGMFRSGSTLIEQVLAAHPQVTPGGELDFLMRLAASRLAPFPQSMIHLDPKREAAFADEYRSHLAQLFPDANAGAYITDKRPDNFLLIGLIKRLFPDARIVHTTRHPMGNGFSIYMQHLHHRVAGYSSDLGDIGHYYGQYRRLMAHWKSLYPDSIYDFDYDDFVSDPVPALQRLFAFLGLDWDERALEFHKLRNTVKTGSYWQVRQPLHGNASGRWRHYDQHLGPLRLALGDAGIVVD